MPDRNDFSPLHRELPDLLRGRSKPPKYECANPGMTGSGQRVFGLQKNERAQFAAVFVIRKHVGPTFLGDLKTVATNVLGR